MMSSLESRRKVSIDDKDTKFMGTQTAFIALRLGQVTKRMSVDRDNS